MMRTRVAFLARCAWLDAKVVQRGVVEHKLFVGDVAVIVLQDAVDAGASRAPCLLEIRAARCHRRHDHAADVGIGRVLGGMGG